MLAEWRLVRFAERSGPSTTTATLCLSGELGIATRTVLSEHLAPLGAKRVDRLVVDVAGVRIMDCATAELILQVSRTALPSGVKPVIRNPRPIVRRLLEVSDLADQFTVECSRHAKRARPAWKPAGSIASQDHQDGAPARGILTQPGPAV